MGLIGTILGAGGAARQVGEAVGGVAEVFVGNRAERDAAASAAVPGRGRRSTAPSSPPPASGPFDRFVNALNRLPRPMLALGTLGLFVYAMAEPAGFSTPDAGAGAGARAALVAARRHRLVLLRRPRAAPPADPQTGRARRRHGDGGERASRGRRVAVATARRRAAGARRTIEVRRRRTPIQRRARGVAAPLDIRDRNAAVEELAAPLPLSRMSMAIPRREFATRPVIRPHSAARDRGSRA